MGAIDLESQSYDDKGVGIKGPSWPTTRDVEAVAPFIMRRLSIYCPHFTRLLPSIEALLEHSEA